MRALLFLFLLAFAGGPAMAKRPNVLFIAVDDLNDWVGCLGGHPQAHTPHIDALAKRGVLFEQAHCSAPLCNPSRTSLLMGLRPTTTGIYGNKAWFRDLPAYRDWVTLPQYFRKNGYQVWGGGKIFHLPSGKFSDPASWDHQYSKRMGVPCPPKEKRYLHGLQDRFDYNPILQRLIDWGPLPQAISQTPDWQTADGAAQILAKEQEKPFFLACGIYLPHLPWYAPQEFFALHPLENIQLPKHKADDFDDIPPIGMRMVGKTGEIIRTSGKWKEAVQACLASDSFADACVGHVLAALEKSAHRDNTIVVLWGDHGYDVGEKKFAKSALWEQCTRTPLIIHLPSALRGEGTPKEMRCKRPVSLVDLYPTLLDLCGLPERDGLDGRSIGPLVKNPSAAWPYPAVVSHSPKWHGQNHAVRSERYHYIRYRDGKEELYDCKVDPLQWNNLAGNSSVAEILQDHRKWLPKNPAEHYLPTED